MRDVIVSLFASLDGFATDSDEKMDWVMSRMGQDPGLQEASLAQVMAAGTLVYGRSTYATMAAAWPNNEDEAGFADQMNSLPKLVFSKTLRTAEWNNSTIDRSAPPAGVARLKAEPGGDILIYGSLTVVAKETIELAFLATSQLLPPRQRAVLILRDVLGWSANDTASALGTSVPAVNSALQRARSTLHEHHPDRLDMTPPPDPTGTERALLLRFLDAHDRADVTAVVELLRADVRFTMPPALWWLDGRDTVATAYEQGFASGEPSDWKRLPTSANRQPAAACYRRLSPGSLHRPFTIEVLRIEDGAIAEITSFGDPTLFPAFGLPATL